MTRKARFVATPRNLMLGALVIGCLFTPLGARAAGKRLAVVIGANAAAPGTQPLRYAQADADSMTEVLTSVGGVSPENVTRLYDPTPQSLLEALDKALSRLGGAPGSVLLFYYSGHGDGQAVYPGGRPLSLKLLRARLENPLAQVRIGMIDTCRGGGWTGSKGLSEVPAFDIGDAFAATTQGTALIASSSGLAAAHESEQLLGSFFTHHWISALRGSGDFNQDGSVTLTEAFDYARARTLRDTARESLLPQRPSYQVNLQGQEDFALTRLERGRSLLRLKQERGPLSVLHLSSGLLVAERHLGQERRAWHCPRRVIWCATRRAAACARKKSKC